MENNKKGFTLAETLIVLTSLGIIAAIVIPSFIHKNIETQNRTMVKKAMSAYDTAISKMLIENRITDETLLRQWADTEVKNQCANTSKYFKIKSGTGCLFKTMDNISWYIDDILNPIISVKDFENADDAKTKALDKNSTTTFKLLTLYDEKIGAFRTNDLEYTHNNGSEDQIAELENVYNFIKYNFKKNIKDSSDNSETSTDNQEEEPQIKPEVFTPANTCNTWGCCSSYTGSTCKEDLGSTKRNFDEYGRIISNGTGFSQYSDEASYNNVKYVELSDGIELEIHSISCNNENSVSSADCNNSTAPVINNLIVVKGTQGEGGSWSNVKGQITCTGNTCTCQTMREAGLCTNNIDAINAAFSKYGLNYTVSIDSGS